MRSLSTDPDCVAEGRAPPGEGSGAAQWPGNNRSEEELKRGAKAPLSLPLIVPAYLPSSALTLSAKASAVMPNFS